MHNSREEFIREGMAQLSEKQAEEMDQMLAQRYDLPKPVHSNDQERSRTFADLFSGLPVDEE